MLYVRWWSVVFKFTLFVLSIWPYHSDMVVVVDALICVWWYESDREGTRQLHSVVTLKIEIIHHRHFLRLNSLTNLLISNCLPQFIKFFCMKEAAIVRTQWNHTNCVLSVKSSCSDIFEAIVKSVWRAFAFVWYA